jgi:hypothetical protein
MLNRLDGRYFKRVEFWTWSRRLRDDSRGRKHKNRRRNLSHHQTAPFTEVY